MVGAALLVPAGVALTARAVARATSSAASPAGRLAAASLGASVGRHAIATAALLVAIAMVVGMAILVESFDRSVLGWARQSLRADLWVEPLARTPGTLEGTLDESIADRVAALPFVAAVDRFRGIEVLIDGKPAFLGAGEARVLAERGALPLLDGERHADVLPRLAGADAVLVSEAFAIRRGARAGDTLALPTPRGPVAFRVLAVYRDYSSDRGYVVMDRATFLAHWGDTALSTIAVYLREGVDAEAARAAVIEATRGLAQLDVLTIGTLRGEIERALRGTFAVTYALTAIGLVVAILAIATTLAAIVIEERRTIGVLRALGASAGQVLRVILFEAVLLGVIDAVAGFATGFSLAWLLVFVINRQSFGWTLSYSAPGVELVALFVAVPIVAALAGLGPARRAAQLSPREAMSRD
jgi:putative ABC transport system permease protein